MKEGIGVGKDLFLYNFPICKGVESQKEEQLMSSKLTFLRVLLLTDQNPTPLGVVQLDTNYTTRRWFQTFVSTSIWGDEPFYTNCNLATYCIFLIWIETT